MVVLHGLGDSASGYLWLPPALDLPSMNYLLVNAPDRYYSGYAWYDFTGDAAPGIERSRKALSALFDTLPAKGFPTGETTLFGFSQGCLMIIEAGLRYPHRFAGLAGISGYVFDPERLINELSPVALQQRVLFTHGTQDPLIPFAEVREQINALKGAGLRIDWHEFVKAHTIAGEEEINLIRKFVVAGYEAP